MVLLLLMTAACATLHAPAMMPRFEGREMAHSGSAGLTVRAMPLRGQDDYWSVFDDYLPEAGIGAVWVSVKSGPETKADFSRVRWILRRGSSELTALGTDDLFKAYYRARGIRMYSLETDRRARLSIEKIRFQPGQIRPSSAREGFLFFRIEAALSDRWAGGTLIADGIRLDGRTSVLELRFAHANP